ncbi:hypothetical protein BN903_68 [Halorubrum sp. AJ67]|nr:hypothetical protein BN903_68 [Halorubrum sp. AJ67]
MKNANASLGVAAGPRREVDDEDERVLAVGVVAADPPDRVEPLVGVQRPGGVVPLVVGGKAHRG